MKYEVRVYSNGYHRTWGVYQIIPNHILPDGGENLVAVCVYKKGAQNVARLLNVYQDILNKEVA